MNSRELLKQFGSSFCQRDINFPPVAVALLPDDQTLCFQTVDEADGAVVLDMESFGQLAVRHMLATGKAFDCQERLLLGWRESDGMGRLFAELKKLPQRMAKRRQRFIVCL